MDWFQFMGAMAGHFAWPVAAVVLGSLFRKQVRNLLEKMRTFKGPGGIEASFPEEWTKAAEDANEIRAETQRMGTLAGSMLHRDLKPENEHRSDRSPHDWMLSSWKCLEEAAREYAAATGAIAALAQA